MRWPAADPKNDNGGHPNRLLDREAAGSAAAASAVVSLLFALESVFLWESPRRRRLRRALTKSFAVIEGGRRSSSSNSGRIAVADREEEGSSDGSGGDSGGGSSGRRKQQRQQLPPVPPRLCIRGGGPLVAAAVAALGSAWGLAAAAFLVLAAESQESWLPPGASASGAAPSSFLSALPRPRGLPARGISLLAAAGCFAAAVTTTHGVGGRATAGGASAAASSPAAPSSSSPSSSPSPSPLRRRFRFWQPFRGGGAFIATQAVGWSLTGLGTLGFLKVSAAVIASAARTSATAAAAVASAAASASTSSSPLLFDVLLTAALMPVAQAVLALSVSLWDASGEEQDQQNQRQKKKLHFERAAARSRSHPNSLPPLSTWPIIVLIYAPAHVTISLIVAVLAASPLFGGLFLAVALALYYGITERGNPARTGRRHWPSVADALARVAEPALAAWHGGLEVVHDDLEGDEEWEAHCSRAEEDVSVLLTSLSSPAAPPSSSSSSAARALVRSPLSDAEPAILGVAPHGLFPASLLYLGRLEAFRVGGGCWPKGRAAPTPAVASAVMRVPVLRDLASFMGARAVTRSAIADALKLKVKAIEREESRSKNDTSRKHRRGSGSGALSPTAASSSSTLLPLSAAPSVALVPGGQSELIHTWRLHSRKELVLVRRHAGFVRLALAQNAALVPVLVLGEAASLADAISLPTLKAKSIKVLGFPVPFLVSGRFFPGSPLPRGGTPLRFVVGPAVRVAKVGGGGNKVEGEAEGENGKGFDGEEEAVAEAHERYFKAVERLFSRHAGAAGHGDVRLVWADEGPERKMRRGGKEEEREGEEVEVGGAASFVADASVTVSVSVSGSAKKTE